MNIKSFLVGCSLMGAVVTLGDITAAHASPILDQSFLGPADFGGLANSSNIFAQTVTNGITGVLTGVDISLFQHPSNIGTFTIDIWHKAGREYYDYE